MIKAWVKTASPKRPLLLAVFAGIMIAQAITVLPLLFLIIMISDADSPITINGVERTLADIRFPILAVIGMCWLFVGKVGFGLWRGHAFARHAYFLWLVLSAFLVVLLFGSNNALAPVVLPVLFVGWYLYGKTNVKQFFSKETKDPMNSKTFRGMG